MSRYKQKKQRRGRRITVRLSPEVHERVRLAAKREGLTTKAFVNRAAIWETLRSERPVLMAFSEGKLSKESAIDQLGLRDYAQLLKELGRHELPLPTLPEAELEAMVENFVRVWQGAGEA